MSAGRILVLQAGVVGPFVPFVVEYRMVVSFALYVGIRVLFGGKIEDARESWP